jgi:hypothetical protein
MSDFRARLFEEFNQLSQRIQKLRDFIISDKFDDLAEIDRKDLKEQLKHMQGYYDVLSRRSSRLCGDA